MEKTTPFTSSFLNEEIPVSSPHLTLEGWGLVDCAYSSVCLSLSRKLRHRDTGHSEGCIESELAEGRTIGGREQDAGWGM